MLWMLAKALIAGGIIAFTSWLSGKKPELAGFIIALPLASMLALLFSYTEFQDADKSAAFARSILVAVPLSLMFFLPFFFAEKFHLPFWAMYGIGTALVIAGYFIHRQWLGYR